MLNPIAHRKILKKGMPGTATILAIGALTGEEFDEQKRRILSG